MCAKQRTDERQVRLFPTLQCLQALAIFCAEGPAYS
jgi:hypothetical protein